MIEAQILGYCDGTEIRLPLPVQLPESYSEWKEFEDSMEEIPLSPVIRGILREYARDSCENPLEELEGAELIDLDEDEFEDKDYIDAR